MRSWGGGRVAASPRHALTRGRIDPVHKLDVGVRVFPQTPFDVERNVSDTRREFIGRVAPPALALDRKETIYSPTNASGIGAKSCEDLALGCQYRVMRGFVLGVAQDGIRVHVQHDGGVGTMSGKCHTQPS